MNAVAEKRIARARSVLIQDEPFLGVLSMALAIVEKPEIETMATDGASLAYAPDYVASIDDAELLFVVAHEVMHCGYSHHARIGNRDLAEFNKAADYALNGELIRLRIGRAPKGILHDARFDNMGAEEIYAVLQAEKRKAKQDAQNGQGKPAGGGGTRFDDTFRWIGEHAPDATAIVYLTDMEIGASHWGEEPGALVYWAVHGARGAFDRLASQAPFGEAVYIGRLG
jgi:predicted metal-dependent peptidase